MQEELSLGTERPRGQEGRWAPASAPDWGMQAQPGLTGSRRETGVAPVDMKLVMGLASHSHHLV